MTNAAIRLAVISAGIVSAVLLSISQANAAKKEAQSKPDRRQVYEKCYQESMMQDRLMLAQSRNANIQSCMRRHGVEPRAPR